MLDCLESKLDFVFVKILSVTNFNWAKWFHAPIPIQFRTYYITNLFLYFVLYLVEFHE